MNSQYENQRMLQSTPTSLYDQNSHQNSYDPQTGLAFNKGFNRLPYDNGTQNGLPINYSLQAQNQSYKAQSAGPPTNVAMNQVTQDFNSLHLTQNHPLYTNNHPPPRFPIPPMQSHGAVNSIQNQQHHLQSSMPLQDPGLKSQKPPVPFPNVNSLKPLAPTSNSGIPYSPSPNMYGSSNVPSQQNSSFLPPHHNMLPPQPNNISSSNVIPQQNNGYISSAPPPQGTSTYSSIQQNSAYIPSVSSASLYNNYTSSAVTPSQENNYSSTLQTTNRNPQGPSINDVHPSQSQHQINKSIPPFTNGSEVTGPPQGLSAAQHSYNQSSNMHARYPPAPLGHDTSSGNALPNSSVPQYMQYNNSMYSQQNRLGGASQQSTASKRLDPDHMPSPIQVIEEDRQLRSTYFLTAQRGLVPPLVTTDFEVVDQGFCSPRFIRSTIYSVPTTADILKQTNVPFALAINPFAHMKENEQPPSITDPGEDGPVRCHRCRAYMSPFMQFIDAGRRFQCMLCKTTTEVPAHYFTHLDHVGQRADKFERPELCLGSYEYIVNKDYCKEGKFPNCPAFIFLIDVSYNGIHSGMVKTLCDNMRSILTNLPRDHGMNESKLRVGFITFSSVVHFYNINSNLAQPQMLVVSDVHDMFMPLLDGFLANPTEATANIDSLMEQIPIMFAETRETETILGPAIQAGLEALKAAECAGKLFIFHSTLPIAEAPGKLKNRDDRKLLGTDKEKTILSPQSTFYNNLGQECVKSGCSVDLFLFNNAYIDVASLGQICRLTGGRLYKYTYFQSDIDGSRFLEDVRKNVQKFIAFDAVLRVRTSTGIRPTDFIGSFFMSNTTDVELASVTCDTSLSIEIKYDDKLTEEDGVCIQCAVLYTSCSGQRRLRVHNLALNTCVQMADLFRNCELDTMMNFFLKDGVRRVTEETPKQIKERFTSKSAQILACYRKNCAQVSSAGQLILPECMKLLPLYTNCLLKSDALSGGQEMTTDDRSFIMLATLSMDVDSTAAYLYPRLLPLHEAKPDLENFALPVAVRCSIERIKKSGVYLLENGLNMFLYVDLNADSEWVKDVFGVTSAARIDVEKNHLVQLNTPSSRWIRMVIDHIQSQRQRHMKLYIVRTGDQAEYLFRLLLVEDQTTESSDSYVDYLCHLHKEIRNLLS